MVLSLIGAGALALQSAPPILSDFQYVLIVREEPRAQEIMQGLMGELARSSGISAREVPSRQFAHCPGGRGLLSCVRSVVAQNEVALGVVVLAVERVERTTASGDHVSI